MPAENIPSSRRRSPKRTNSSVIIIDGAECRTIPLTQGQVAIVDVADYEWLSQFNWSAHWSPTPQTFYAVRGEGPRANHKRILMHREVMGNPAGVDIDHWNRNGIDNRRSNLRVASRSQNSINSRMKARNTSGFRGVSWDKGTEKWRAYIRIDGKRVHLGLFLSKEEAAQAYDAAAKRYHGQFAVLNFPGD